jgi:iron-sulfur cluster repair protein YtfE (RIC family)
MPVQIGVKTHSFADPTALLSDCHRRIEMFLGALAKVAAHIEDPLTDDTRLALEASLRYFRDAAPKHTADEEESVFPRLRRSSDLEAKGALAALDELEQEHRRADSLHGKLDALGRKCLSNGHLSNSDACQFQEAIAELASIYKRHIHIEDDLVFPIATKVLSPADKALIAAEMSARR